MQNSGRYNRGILNRWERMNVSINKVKCMKILYSENKKKHCSTHTQQQLLNYCDFRCILKYMCAWKTSRYSTHNFFIVDFVLLFMLTLYHNVCVLIFCVLYSREINIYKSANAVLCWAVLVLVFVCIYKSVCLCFGFVLHNSSYFSFAWREKKKLNLCFFVCMFRL